MRFLVALFTLFALAACGPSIGYDAKTPTHSLTHPSGALRITVPQRYGLCGSGEATIHARTAAKGTITPECPETLLFATDQRYPKMMSFSLRERAPKLEGKLKTTSYKGRDAAYTITGHANGNGDTYYVFEGYVPFDDGYLVAFAEDYTEFTTPRFQTALTAMFTATAPE